MIVHQRFMGRCCVYVLAYFDFGSIARTTIKIMPVMVETKENMMTL
jgi:hypothetical protein